MTSALKDAGYEPHAAGCSPDAIRLATQLCPDVILLNVAFSELPDTGLCRLFKTSSKLTGTPVVHVWTRPTSIPGVAQGPDCGADCYLHHPVSTETLLVCVRAMLRVKAAEEKLGRVQELWHTVFARSRDAVLLVGEDLRIVDANAKAAELYGYPTEELTEMSVRQLCPEHGSLEHNFGLASRAHAAVWRTEQQTKFGERFPAELQCRKFIAPTRTSFEMIVSSLSEDPRAEIEARAVDREINLLSAYSAAREDRSVAAELYDGGPLSRCAPARFAQLADMYDGILELALDGKAFRIETGHSDQLRRLAERLAELDAGPRDVTELHALVLKKKVSAAQAIKKHAYVEEGRLLLLQLMGYLASYYRSRSFRSLASGSQ